LRSVTGQHRHYNFRMRRLSLAVALCLPIGCASAEDIVTLPTRGGVTQSYLLAAPDGGKAQAVALLFAGGMGRVDLERETARRGPDRGNFLVRSRQLFAQRGIAAAVMDAPSDETAGMNDEFRLGSSHAADIAKVVADLKSRFPGAPVFLVGTSRGTLSAASAGKQLGQAVDGVVLTATLFLAAGQRPGLSGFDFATIPSPVLFVHHVDDGCAYTPYSSARRLAGRFPVVSVSGGRPAESKPCEAMSAHGFLGKEPETVGAIANWMLKRAYPREIN
jgi:hypothetical protein